MTIEDALERLKSSPFRARFHLNEKDKAYALKLGEENLRRHAEDFVATRLAPAVIPNDGRQTPMRGHPVFVAQHACACCCRGCLNKWYHVPLGVALNQEQRQKIVDLLLAWIKKDLER